MRTWRDVSLRIFLKQEHRSFAQRKGKHKVGLLAAAAARRISTQQREASSLVRSLTEIVQELDAPQLDKQPGAETSQEAVPVVTGEGQTEAQAHSLPSLEASQQDALGDTSLPQPDLLPLDDDWLDPENSLHAEESWLFDTSNVSSSGTECVPEDRVDERCREVESTGRGQVIEGDVLLEALDVSPDCKVAGEEPRPHVVDIASGLEWPHLLKTAKSAIVAFRRTGGGGLQELRVICNALKQQRVIRLAEVHCLSRRLCELQARVLHWRTSRGAAPNSETATGGPAITAPQGEAFCSAEKSVSAEGAACRTETSDEVEKDGSPGWLSVNQTDQLRLRVHRLEATLASTCQEMVGRLGALWDQLQVPLANRAAMDAQGEMQNVLARYDCLEQQLVQAQAQVTLLQPIILLCQQRDELGRQLESQAATCREASKHLLSRKADGASALRRAEAERKRLLRQHSTVQKQLGGAIGEWEKTTGGRYEEDCHSQRWKDHGLEETLGFPERSRRPGLFRKGSAVVTRFEHACPSDGRESVLISVPANII